MIDCSVKRLVRSQFLGRCKGNQINLQEDKIFRLQKKLQELEKKVSVSRYQWMRRVQNKLILSRAPDLLGTNKIYYKNSVFLILHKL